MEDSEILYRQYAKKIYNLAFRMTGNSDDAKDITQETFVQVFKSIDQFRGQSQIYSWLYQIAKNNCIRFLAKKSKTTFISLQGLIDKVSSPVSEEISEAEKSIYITQIKDGCLSGLLRCLSLQQRLAFILTVLLDLPVEQVADIIEKSENATRILVHRSKQNIREFLCRNCSLYDSKNSCQCENLLNFSLKQGWIGLNSAAFSSTGRIESEIKNLKDVVRLYKTLHEHIPSVNFNEQIKKMLADKENILIFSDKKVK